MILKKTVVDGKVVYEPISKEEALALKGKDLLFTDEDEEEELEDLLEEQEHEDEDEDDEVEEEDEEDEEESEEEERGNSQGGFFFGNRAKWQRHGGFFGMLPFLDDEDIHQYVEQLLQGEGPLKGVSLVAIMPFLKDDDCDRLVLKYLDDSADKSRCSITALAPFVSEECLSKIVDGYLAGKYQNLSLESLYPFLSSRDVRRLFAHFAAKRRQGRD